jgi:HEAT repeat protein
MRASRFLLRFAAVSLVLTVGASASQAPPAVAAEVSSLLARFPASDAAGRDEVCAEITRLGPRAVGEICRRLLPPDKGDSSQAQFALNGLAVYVTRPGAERERLDYVGSLLAAVETSRDEWIRTFLISQIEVAGREEAVKPLAKYLRDESLSGPAARAIQSIGSPQAARALLKALGAVPEAAKPILIKALGELRSREAFKKIIPYASSPDPDLRRIARFALANIGDARAAEVLGQSRVAASPLERSEAPSFLLLFAERLIESGDEGPGLDICRDLLEHYAGPGETHIASGALNLMASVLGEEVLDELLRALDSPEAEYRGAALALAGKIPGPEATRRWIDRLGSVPPPVQAEVIAMLGERGDSSALPAVRDALESPDKAVRTYAVGAATKLGGELVLPDLLPLLLAGEEKDEIGVVKEALLGMSGSLVVPEAVRLIGAAPPEARAALIDILGEKGARGEIDLVFREIVREEPEVRAAAGRALALLAGEEDLPRLLDLLDEASTSEEVVNLQNAVVTAVLRNPDPGERADVVLGLLEQAPKDRKARLLRIFPRIGGIRLFEALVAETKNEDAGLRGIAVSALSRWPDFRAADELLRILSSTENRQHFLLALEGYVRLVGRSGLPRGTKAGLLMDILALPRPDGDKKAALRGLVPLRGPDAFAVLAGYLANPDLRAEAIEALFETASSQAPEERWLSGHQAISVLRRAEALVTDPAERKRAREIIAGRLEQGGFVRLFNERGLHGWKGLVSDPPARRRMTAAELENAQVEADGRMRAHWSVADGSLVFDGRGESLATAKDYGDFELLVDWKIEKGGDSGIYLRGSPQVQIWDAEANPEGSGGLYNNQKHPNRPREKADLPAGEWNAFRIIMIGERVTVYLNDRMVVGNTPLENYWDRERPIDESGQIELQAHGHPLRFRNIWIREIPRDPGTKPGLTPSEKAEGFAVLFNGTDLGGWTGDTEGYAARDGKIVTDPERGSGNLYTAAEYSDFVLRFEFKLTPAANNGLGIRAPLEGDAAYAGMEIQILEDGSPAYWDLRPYQYHGSVYGVVPAKRGILKPVGEWNTEEVTVQGTTIKVVVNGTTVVDSDTAAAAAEGTMDGRDHPGLARTRGHIGFLGHGSIVEFRNIRIRELR